MKSKVRPGIPGLYFAFLSILFFIVFLTVVNAADYGSYSNVCDMDDVDCSSIGNNYLFQYDSSSETWQSGPDANVPGDVMVGSVLYGPNYSEVCGDVDSPSMEIVGPPLTVNSITGHNGACSPCDWGALMFFSGSLCPDLGGGNLICLQGTTCCDDQTGPSPFSAAAENAMKGENISAYIGDLGGGNYATLYSFSDDDYLDYLHENYLGGAPFLYKVVDIFEWDESSCGWDYNPSAIAKTCSANCSGTGNPAPEWESAQVSWNVFSGECTGCGPISFSVSPSVTGEDYGIVETADWRVEETGDAYLADIDGDDATFDSVTVTNEITVNGSGTSSFAGDVDISGELDVGGHSAFGDSADVSEYITVNIKETLMGSEISPSSTQYGLTANHEVTPTTGTDLGSWGFQNFRSSFTFDGSNLTDGEMDSVDSLMSGYFSASVNIPVGFEIEGATYGALYQTNKTGEGGILGSINGFGSFINQDGYVHLVSGSNIYYQFGVTSQATMDDFFGEYQQLEAFNASEIGEPGFTTTYQYYTGPQLYGASKIDAGNFPYISIGEPGLFEGSTIEGDLIGVWIEDFDQGTGENLSIKAYCDPMFAKLSDTLNANLILRRGRGYLVPGGPGGIGYEVPSGIQDEDIIGTITARGYSGTSSSDEDAAYIRFIVDDSPGDTPGDMPARVEIGTSPDGTATPVPVARFSSDGLSSFLYDVYMSNVSTAGSVPFVNSSGYFDEDNSSFFWDDSTKRLGIGTNSPDYALHMVSANNTRPRIRLEGTYSWTESPRIDFYNNSTTPANEDNLLKITAIGNNDSLVETDNFVRIFGIAKEVADGNEAGEIYIMCGINGSMNKMLAMGGDPGGVSTGFIVFNEHSYDVDYRIESTNDEYAFLIDGNDGDVWLSYDTDDYFLFDNSNGNIGLSRSPTYRVDVMGDSLYSSSIRLTRNQAANTGPPSIYLQKDRDGSAVQDNDNLGMIYALGYDGDSYETGARIQFKVDGTVADGAMPTRIEFLTSPVGSSTTVQRMYIYEDGKVEIETPSDIGREAFAIDHADTDEPFIRFEGLSATDLSSNFTTLNGDGAVDGPKNYGTTTGLQYVGAIRVSVVDDNGSGIPAGDYWIPLYEEDNGT